MKKWILVLSILCSFSSVAFADMATADPRIQAVAFNVVDAGSTTYGWLYHVVKMQSPQWLGGAQYKGQTPDSLHVVLQVPDSGEGEDFVFNMDSILQDHTPAGMIANRQTTSEPGLGKTIEFDVTGLKALQGPQGMPAIVIEFEAMNQGTDVFYGQAEISFSR